MELESIVRSDPSQVMKGKYHVISPYVYPNQSTCKQPKYNVKYWNKEQSYGKQRGGGKDNMMTMSQEIWKLNKQKEIINNNQMETPGLKSTNN